MALKKQRRGGKVYVSQYRNYRDKDGKVRSEFQKYLGVEVEPGVYEKPRGKIIDRVVVRDSYRSGDVGLLWALAQELDLPHIIDSVCFGESLFEGPTPGMYLTAWAINRCISPCSASRLGDWIRTTDLPRLMGMPPEMFKKDRFLDALDFVSVDNGPHGNVIDLTTQLDDAFTRSWREREPLPPGEREVLAYDMTTVLFFGVSCPLAELGYNPDRIQRRQVNLALLVSRREKYPLAHFVYEGSRNSASTVENLMVRLRQSSLCPGTLIWDRGNMSEAHVKAVEDAGWDLISGVPKSLNSVQSILEGFEVDMDPSTLTRRSEVGHVYSDSTTGELYGRNRKVAVYTNSARSTKDRDTRNDALSTIGEDLDALAEKGSDWSEKKLHTHIKRIVGKYSDLITVRVKRSGDGQRIEWGYKSRELSRLKKLDGKYLVLATDESLSAKDAVNAYLEKDFIEKSFRTLKSDEEIAPVRHRLEHRVRAYLFVLILAFRLRSYLQWLIKQAEKREDGWEACDRLLERLGRVERTDVMYGNQSKAVSLNVTKSIRDTLSKIGYEWVVENE